MPAGWLLAVPLLAALAACGGAQGDLWSLDGGLEPAPAAAPAKLARSKADCSDRYGAGTAAGLPDVPAAPPAAEVAVPAEPVAGSPAGPGPQPIAEGGPGAGWSSPVSGELEELVLFPRFVVGTPGLGAYSPDCELGDDPYGNCL